MDRASIAEEIRRRAMAAQLDPNAMVKIAQIESGLNPNAKNPNSSASGVFQFINSTGRQYGLKNPFDPVSNIDAGIRLASDNRAALSRALGREPTPGELYLAHQQGIGGATKLLSNPNARAADLVGGQAVRLNAGSPNMTAAQFASQWDRKMGGGDPLNVTVRKPPEPPPSLPAWGPAREQMSVAPEGSAAPPQMTPEQFQTAVYNSGQVSSNEALDSRLKDDAVQRGYASWDQALSGMKPQISPEQDMLAKLLSGAWG